MQLDSAFQTPQQASALSVLTALSPREQLLISAMAALGSLLSEPDLRRLMEELGESLVHSELQLLLDQLTVRGMLRKRHREYRIHAQWRVAGVALALHLSLGPRLLATAQWQFHNRKEQFDLLVAAWIGGRTPQQIREQLRSTKLWHQMLHALLADRALWELIPHLSLNWQLELTAEALPRQSLGGQLDGSVLQFCEQLCDCAESGEDDDPRLLQIKLSLATYRLLEHPDNYKAPVLPEPLNRLHACDQLLVKGQWQLALTGYQSGLKHWRKKLALRSGYLPGLCGLLHGLSLLATGERDELGKLHRWYERQVGKDEAAYFLKLILIAQGDWQEHDSWPRKLAEADDTDSFLLILAAWRCMQDEQRMLIKQNETLQKYHRQWCSDTSWLSQQMADIAARLLELPTGISDEDSLAHCLPPLKQIAERDVTYSDQRLIWQLTATAHGGVDIQAKVQRGQGERWSAGQVVGIAELQTALTHREHSNAMLVKCITDDDEILLEHFAQGARAFDPDAKCSQTASLLQVMTEHPRVFDGAGKRIQVFHSPPQLHVEQDKQHLRLRQCPAISEGCYFLDSADGNLQLSVFPDGWQRLGRILSQFDHQLPVAQAGQLAPVLDQLAQKVAIVSSSPAVDSRIRRIRLKPVFQVVLHQLPNALQIGLRLKLPSRPNQASRLIPGMGPEVLWQPPGTGSEHVCLQRDLLVERELAEQLCCEFGSPLLLMPDNPQCQWLLSTPQTIRQALASLQRGLRAGRIALVWSDGRAVGIKQLTRQPLKLQISDQGQWLSAQGQFHLDEQHVLDLRALLALLQQQSVPVAENGDLVLADDHLQSLLNGLSDLSDDKQAKDAKDADKALLIPHSRALSLDQLTESIDVNADQSWQRVRQRLRHVERELPKLSSSLLTPLRDYQRQGVQWLRRLGHLELGACLADDMGLGKTLQALILLAERAEQGPALVVAPKSVCANWPIEALRFASSLNVLLLSDSTQREADIEQAGANSVIVLSYGLLPSIAESVVKKVWATVVLDEAQAIKNPDTKRAKIIHQLDASFRLALTGTPIENHLGELWSLFQFLNPGLLGSRSLFQSRFSAVGEQDNPVLRGRLQRLIAPFILRRTKETVLTELPGKTEITLHVQLSEPERVLYEALRKQAIGELFDDADTDDVIEQPQSASVRMLSALTKLRRACCHPQLVLPEADFSSSKLQLAGQVIEELRENGHRSLVFSQFVDHLSKVRDWLDGQGIRYCYLDGQTSAKRRQQQIELFQQPDGPELFLISLKAGGTGLNLTAADYVLHLDPWWNPAVESQATDRAHRMGQTKPVTVYRLVADDTIESKIVKLHQNKRALAEGLLAGSERSANLSMADLKELITGSVD